MSLSKGMTKTPGHNSRTSTVTCHLTNLISMTALLLGKINNNKKSGLRTEAPTNRLSDIHHDQTSVINQSSRDAMILCLYLVQCKDELINLSQLLKHGASGSESD